MMAESWEQQQAVGTLLHSARGILEAVRAISHDARMNDIVCEAIRCIGRAEQAAAADRVPAFDRPLPWGGPPR